MDFKLLEKIQKDIGELDKLKTVKLKNGEYYQIPFTENDVGIFLEYQTQILAVQADLLTEILIELTKLNKNNE